MCPDLNHNYDEYKPSFGVKRKPVIDSKILSRSPDGMDLFSHTDSNLYDISRSSEILQQKSAKKIPNKHDVDLNHYQKNL